LIFSCDSSFFFFASSSIFIIILIDTDLSYLQE
jgi:hypothetical protein